MIDFGTEDPVSVIKRLIDGHGVDCMIDAVGVDTQHTHGESAKLDKDELKKNQELVQ